MKELWNRIVRSAILVNSPRFSDSSIPMDLFLSLTGLFDLFDNPKLPMDLRDIALAASERLKNLEAQFVRIELKDDQHVSFAFFWFKVLPPSSHTILFHYSPLFSIIP